jgi:hypothetical protein
MQAFVSTEAAVGGLFPVNEAERAATGGEKSTFCTI